MTTMDNISYLNKSDFKSETVDDLQDCLDVFERVIDQVPSFDQYLINNIDSYESTNFLNDQMLIVPSSLSSSTLSTIKSSPPHLVRSHSLSSPSTSSLSPQTLSSESFDIKKEDTISSYLNNIELDENSRY